MKKFIKWFLVITMILGCIALAICYIVIPERTKAAADVVVGYMNTPLFIAGGSTITLGVVVGAIIKSIYDRYKDNVKDELNNIKLDFEAKKKEIEDKYNKEKEEFKNEIKELKDEIKIERSIAEDCIKQLREFCDNNIELFELIPNKKVQEKVEELYGREERINEETDKE